MNIIATYAYFQLEVFYFIHSGEIVVLHHTL